MLLFHAKMRVLVKAVGFDCESALMLIILKRPEAISEREGRFETIVKFRNFFKTKKKDQG